MYEQIGLFTLDRTDIHFSHYKILIYETTCSLMEFNNWDYEPFYQLLTNEYIPPKFKSYMPAHHYDAIVKFIKDYSSIKCNKECIKIGQIDHLDTFVTTIPPIKTLYMLPYEDKYHYTIQELIKQFIRDPQIFPDRITNKPSFKNQQEWLTNHMYRIFLIDSVLELTKFKYTAGIGIENCPEGDIVRHISNSSSSSLGSDSSS